MVPGEAELTIEARSLSEDAVSAFIGAVLPRVDELMKERGLRVEPVFATDAAAATSDERILRAIESAAQALGHDYLRMSSGAGHDAGHLAPVAPIGMIFVPSEAGVSHNPAEYTSLEELMKGVNVLLHAILGLDQALS